MGKKRPQGARRYEYFDSNEPQSQRPCGVATKEFQSSFGSHGVSKLLAMHPRALGMSLMQVRQVVEYLPKPADMQLNKS